MSHINFRLHSEHGDLFRDYTPHKSQKISKCFLGSDLVTWFVQQGRAGFRPEAEASCRKLLENGIIRHGNISRHMPIVISYSLDICDSSILLTNLTTFHIFG